MKFDRSMGDKMDRDISPPMRYAITLPVLNDDGSDTGVVVYVSVSPWGKGGEMLPSLVVSLSHVVSRGLELKPGRNFGVPSDASSERNPAP